MLAGNTQFKKKMSVQDRGMFGEGATERFASDLLVM
jgi:hypothetical protein